MEKATMVTSYFHPGIHMSYEKPWKTEALWLTQTGNTDDSLLWTSCGLTFAKPQLWLPGRLLPGEGFASTQLKQVSYSSQQDLGKMLFFSMIKSPSKPLCRRWNPLASERGLTTRYLWENSASFDQMIDPQNSEFTHHVLWKNNICSCNPTFYGNAGKWNCPGNQESLRIYSWNLRKIFWHWKTQICQNLNLHEPPSLFILPVKNVKGINLKILKGHWYIHLCQSCPGFPPTVTHCLKIQVAAFYLRVLFIFKWKRSQS